jgi:SAM-dependent methyltransferase
MYNEIADMYLEIFPLNRAFLALLPEYIGGPGTAVLDLGCGPGDYVDHLTRSGFRATGIDNSTGMIRQARASKQGDFYELSFTEIDQLKGHFDCIYCVGNSLSYLPSGAVPSFIAGIRDLLNSSGRFILQVVNWDKYHLTGSANFDVIALSDGRTFHRRYEDIDSTQVIFHTMIQKEGEIQGSWSAPLFPKYQQAMVEALLAAGLTVTGQFGDYRKSPFEPDSSPALILTAQKQADLTLNGRIRSGAISPGRSDKCARCPG